jgi:hypothetical protein
MTVRAQTLAPGLDTLDPGNAGTGNPSRPTMAGWSP